MDVVDTFEAVRRRHRGRLGLVPTLGSLHAGHLSLFRRARRDSDVVAVTIFVNPLQFDDPADFDRYPRPLETDLSACRAEGVDVVCVPSQTEVYPSVPLTRVVVAEVTDTMEGTHRPGHFEGVALVVTKLLAGIRPDDAFFGRKDAQQLAVVTTLVRDLSIPTRIVPCPTVREADGLALSSRNVFLGDDERRRASCLSRGLMAAADAVESGERDAPTLEEIARSQMDAADDVEYVELASQKRARLLDRLDRPAFLAVAARVGETRLIDNVAFDPVDGGFRADRGVRLETA